MKLFNRMRNTGIALLGGVVLLTFSAVATGCSDNDEQGLFAADGSNIGLSIEALGYHNGLLDIGSAQSSSVFTVTSTTRWTVDVTDCDGAWCQIVYGEGNSDDAGHIGDGTFMIEAAPNRGNSNRECNVTVYAIESDGTHIPGKSVDIHVVQDRQSIQVDYAGDVISPAGTTPATMPLVTVKANQPWTVSSSHSWVTIVPGEGMDGDSYTGSGEERTVSFRINVAANPGTSVRYAEVTISSPSSAFTPQRLNVTQEGSSDTFFITPTEVPSVTWTGGTIEFNVYSPRDSWSVQAISDGNWVILDRTSGESSSEAVTVQAKVETNNTSVPRQASVVFTRVSGTGERLETIVFINQNASSEAPDPDDTPQVSQPWIGSGWTATYATIYAYFSSPSMTITGAGVVYSNLDDPADQGRITGNIQSGNLITTEMLNLRPQTRYEVWSFIEYVNGGQVMGSRSSSIVFTTPGLNGEPGSGLPGEDDNTPPSPNN